MTADEIKNILDISLLDCEINVIGDGYKFEVTAIGSCFEGLNAVKKQQKVYAALGDKILDGSIHAVTIKAYSPAEWDDISSKRLV